MDKKPVKRKQYEINCKILRIEDNPKAGQNVFIECRLGQRVWIAERWVNYNRPVSMEQFIKDFKKTEVIPKKPTDPLAYVKQEADQPFVIKYTPSD